MLFFVHKRARIDSLSFLSSIFWATVLQLKIDKVILAGMSANLCTESHMRELLEQGFEVGVVKDGTAAAKLPDYDGYKAALVNFRFMASAVLTTEEVEQALSKISPSNPCNPCSGKKKEKSENPCNPCSGTK